jgi:hypothetical protein
MATAAAGEARHAQGLVRGRLGFCCCLGMLTRITRLLDEKNVVWIKIGAAVLL